MKPFKFRPKHNIDGPGGCNNGKRAKRGFNAMRHYLFKELNGPKGDLLGEEDIRDLISDLGHLADKLDLDFEALADMALATWRDER